MTCGHTQGSHIAYDISGHKQGFTMRQATGCLISGAYKVVKTLKTSKRQTVRRQDTDLRRSSHASTGITQLSSGSLRWSAESRLSAAVSTSEPSTSATQVSLCASLEARNVRCSRHHYGSGCHHCGMQGWLAWRMLTYRPMCRSRQTQARSRCCGSWRAS